jgi:Resolvase, N terminal domain
MDLLAPIRVRNAKDGTLYYRRMLSERVLDLDRDGYDHVLETIDDENKTARVHVTAGYAEAFGAVIVDWFYDAAVSGADPIEVRPGFAELLARIADNGVRTIIVETANRFARDLMVQEVGYAMLRGLGVTLVAADSPSSFLDDGPTSNLIRQILGAVSEFDKAWLRPSHPNDFNHTFQWLAELTGKAGRVVPSST